MVQRVVGSKPITHPIKFQTMENKHLIDLTIKYGLDDEALSKIVDMLYQLGYTDSKDKAFMKAATYMCDEQLLDMPADELIEDMKRKGFGVN